MSRFLRPTGARGPADRSRRNRGAVTANEAAVGLRVQSGRTMIAVEVRGRADRTVLLVHGWSGSGDDMRAMATALVDAGYRAVSLDLPAHGASGGVRTTLTEMMRAIAAVASVVGPLDGVVAHSLGSAAVTLALGERMVRARSAVLLAPAVGPIAFVERYRRLIGLPSARVPGMVRRVSERAGRDVALLDARLGARGLDVPALVVHDPEDREVPFEQGMAIAEAWRGSRLLPIDGAGHRKILGDPRVLAATVEFLDSAARQTAA